MTTPYCYLIGWSTLSKFYYGVRYANGCNPKELMTTYKTSSKVVHEFIENFGEPDIIEIRKIFTSKRKAIQYEHKVLRRMKVIYRNDFLNQTDNKSILLSKETRKKLTEKMKMKYSSMPEEERKEKFSRKWTDEEKLKKSISLKGLGWWTNGVDSIKSLDCPNEGWFKGRSIHFTEDGLKRLSEKGKRKYPNRTQTEESNRKRSEKLKGRKATKETREKLSESLKGRKISLKHAEKIKNTLSDGRLKGENNPAYGSKHMKGRKHFNNGVISIMSYECPPGFYPGRLKSDVTQQKP